MTTSPLDDAAADRLLAGRAVDGEPGLTALVAALGRSAQHAPAPRGALVALLAEGFDPTAITREDVPVWRADAPGRRRAWGARVVGASLVAKALLGGGVAVAAMGTATGAGVLPAPVQDGAARVVESLTPFDAPGGSAPSAPRERQPGPEGEASRTAPPPVAPVKPQAERPVKPERPAPERPVLPPSAGTREQGPSVDRPARPGPARTAPSQQASRSQPPVQPPAPPQAPSAKGLSDGRPESAPLPPPGQVGEPSRPTADDTTDDGPTADDATADDPAGDAAGSGQQPPPRRR